MNSPVQTSLPTGLSVFSTPRSVAVVGASSNRTKWGYWLAAGAIAGAGRRDVHLVNARGGDILGHACVTSLAELDEAPELVALCVPGPMVGAVVDEALAMGTRGFLGITAGIEDEPLIAERIRAAGARLVGANSLGIYDAAGELDLSWGNFTPGPMAIISQSGQLGSELARFGQHNGIGVSRFVSIGNQTDVTAAELLADLVDHEATRVVVVYLESFAGGAELFDAVAALRAAGKPVILLTVGASAAGSRLARSHTGSLTAPVDIVDAACRAAGVLRAQSPGEVIDVARSVIAGAAPAGRRTVIVGDSGGQCGIAADQAAAHGLSVPALGSDADAALTALLPAGAATSNPVDLAGAGEADLANYVNAVALALADPDVDSAVLTGYFGCYGADNPALMDDELALAQRLADAARAAGKPLYVHSMEATGPVADALWAAGVPTFGTVEPLLRALSGTAVYSLPARDVTIGSVVGDAPTDGYWNARALLLDRGVAFPAAAVVTSVDEAVAAAAELTAPLVLKAAWLEHKSEVGGVKVGLSGEDVAAVFADMHGRLGDGDYVLEEMDTRPDGVEVLIGCQRHPDLGVTVTVGTGGVATEVYADVVLESAPVDAATAADMISRLKAHKLLAGWRGKPATDVAALADVVAAVSRLAASDSRISEIELNPVRVAPGGVVALDALIVADR
ncbi:CoA-binding protein [Gordonia spumicola]|uniref:CoA-binding protein n=1 Tax=Gordonia spumicola TaxID=589161 RepID=A0A7I9V889_9ACTN|nr:acetate--CoA ligase family protein [Gordonia spumicola]GEE01311.1 CoA-binding protein [Gordonia spumicola]